MGFARLQRAVETVVGVHPGGVGRSRAAVAADNRDARRNAAALLVANVERQLRSRATL